MLDGDRESSSLLGAVLHFFYNSPRATLYNCWVAAGYLNQVTSHQPRVLCGNKNNKTHFHAHLRANSLVTRDNGGSARVIVTTWQWPASSGTMTPPHRHDQHLHCGQSRGRYVICFLQHLDFSVFVRRRLVLMLLVCWSVSLFTLFKCRCLPSPDLCSATYLFHTLQ